jgi:hypothetical protein
MLMWAGNLGNMFLIMIPAICKEKSVIFGIIVARYIALPLIGIFIVRGALRFGFIPQDPLYQFILLLQFAVPPAMNMGNICISCCCTISHNSFARLLPYPSWAIYAWVSCSLSMRCMLLSSML